MFSHTGKGIVVILVIVSMVSSVLPAATVLASAVPDNVSGENGTIPSTGCKPFTPVRITMDGKEVNYGYQPKPDGVTVIKQDCPHIRPPKRPDDDETNPAVWQKYYTDYLAYIGKLTDPKQKQEAWLALAKDLARLSKEKPGMITASLMNKVMNSLAEEYKKMWKDSSYKFDLAEASAYIVKTAVNFVKSDTFWGMDLESQKNFIRSFSNLAVELSWRNAFNATNSGMYAQIGEFFNTLLDRGSLDMKAFAFNKLCDLFGIVSWNNAEVAKGFLATALNDISGGLGGLIQEFMDNLDNSSLSGDARAMIACALSRVFVHSQVLSDVTGFKDINKGQIIQRLDAFLGQVNSGSVTLSAYSRNNLLNHVGSLVGQLISGGADKDYAQSMVNSFVKFAEDSLLLSDKDGGSTTVRATAINILKSLMNKASAKKDYALADKVKNILLKQDPAAFIKEATNLLKTTKNADQAAWLARALANIALFNLQNNTGKVSDEAIKEIMATLAGWIGNKENLSNMRLMGYQTALFDVVSALAAQIYQKGSSLGSDKALADNLVTIFSQLSGLQDAKVKTAAAAALTSLIASLENNGYTELAHRLSLTMKPPLMEGGEI